MRARILAGVTFVAGPLACLAAALLFLSAGTLPDLQPPKPRPQTTSRESAATPNQSRSATPKKEGTVTGIVHRLLDLLPRATRVQPDLKRAYRALGRSWGGNIHWRHYIDPWSRLPAALRPLRVQMNFAQPSVRGYAQAPAPDDRRGKRRPRIQFSKDRGMNSTRGVNLSRRSLFAPVPSAVTFELDIPARASLRTGVGVPLVGAYGPVTFTAEITAAGPPIILLTKTVSPKARNLWFDLTVDLNQYAGKRVKLTLRTSGKEGAFGFWSNPVVERPRAPRPGRNVVFILLDTLRADVATAKVMPRLHELAQTGARFTQAYSLASWTRTSMISMFTSEYTGRFSWKFNTAFSLPPQLRQRMYRKWPRLVTSHLRRQGYHVDAIGNNFFLLGFTPIGFDRDFDRVTDIRAETIDTPAITRGALRYLRANKDRPFFLYLHYDGAHFPYQPPRGFRVKGARAPGAPRDRQFEGYAGEARWTDKHLGPIFDELRKLGLSKDTVVVVTADHGEIFDRRHDLIYGDNIRTIHRHGWSIYDEVLRVPLVISAPGRIPKGTVVTAPVSHLDLIPTVLDLAGAPAMPGAMGMSLAPSLAKQAAPPPRPIVAEARYLLSIREGRFKYIHRRGTTVRYRRATGGRVNATEGDLYDLRADPHETRNLVRQHPKVAKRLRDKLLALVKEGSGGRGSTQSRGAATPEGEGLRLSLRLHGAATRGRRLSGTIAGGGAIALRKLRGRGRAQAAGDKRVRVRLEARAAGQAEIELELYGTSASQVRLDLKLDGKPLTAEAIAVGPFGLRLMTTAKRLPAAQLAALLARRSPASLGPTAAEAGKTPQRRRPVLHLWLGSGGEDEDLDAATTSSAARLADQMLRQAGYAKSPKGTKSNKKNP